LSPSEQGIGEAIIEKDATLVLVDVESGEFIDEPKLALTALRERAQALIQRSRVHPIHSQVRPADIGAERLDRQHQPRPQRLAPMTDA
jgi:hypothetical protein